MKRIAVLCLLLLCARAAWAENFSAYEIKTHGFPIFAPSVIMDNGDMFFHTWDDRAGTIGEDPSVAFGVDARWKRVSGFSVYERRFVFRGTHRPLCRSAMNAM